jgi:hypothetical protein
VAYATHSTLKPVGSNSSTIAADSSDGVTNTRWNIPMMHGPINVKSPNNTSKWQMGFNSAFKGLNTLKKEDVAFKRQNTHAHM